MTDKYKITVEKYNGAGDGFGIFEVRKQKYLVNLITTINGSNPETFQAGVNLAKTMLEKRTVEDAPFEIEITQK